MLQRGRLEKLAGPAFKGFEIVQHAGGHLDVKQNVAENLFAITPLEISVCDLIAVEHEVFVRHFVGTVSPEFAAVLVVSRFD